MVVVALEAPDVAVGVHPVQRGVAGAVVHRKEVVAPVGRVAPVAPCTSYAAGGWVVVAVVGGGGVAAYGVVDGAGCVHPKAVTPKDLTRLPPLQLLLRHRWPRLAACKMHKRRAFGDRWAAR